MVIKADQKIKTITIYDILGKMIVYRPYNQNEITMDVSFLINGIYFVKLKTAFGNTITKKVIVEN